MNILLDIIKGMLIGAANVIPGVSGGTLAVSTGVYEKLINAINNLSKDFKNSFKVLWPIALGAVLGIIVLAIGIKYLLAKFPVPTTSCFIGLVLGGVPVLYNKIKDEKIKWTHIVSFILTLILIIVPAIVAVNTPAVENVELNFINFLILMLLGAISSAAMVVPGISGSLILMMIGYYSFVLGLITNTLSYMLHFEWEQLIGNIILIIPFALGALLGLIIITKVISYALKKWPNASTWGILGLVVASPFAIIVKTGTVTVSPLIIIISIITFILGYLLSSKLGEKE